MLIRWATEADKPGWTSLAGEVAELFGSPNMPTDPAFLEYMDSKISKCEALVAIRRMTGECLGAIGFSRKNNRISWLAVSLKHRREGTGAGLLRCALNQLEPSREITVVTFREGDGAGGNAGPRVGAGTGLPGDPGLPARRLYRKFGFEDAGTVTDPFGNLRSRMVLPPTNARQGGSFHFRYPQYAAWADPENCPVCHAEESDNPPVLIKEMEHSWLECEKEAQGCLFGKCHVLSKVHSVHFYDMAESDMAGFMSDVQKAARALHKVTGAVKINYEIHGNSMPHLHVHLFPRYLDDDFPSGPIDYRKTEPSPYESDEEFEWFVGRMREVLREQG